MTTFPTSSSNKTLRFSWLDGLIVFVLVGLAMIVYGRTLMPGLLLGDGGEFQTLTYLWGHSHPTGYPVYLTLTRLFAWLPTGDLAYRVNLFSTVMALLTVVGVYVCGRWLTRYRLAAAAATLAFACSPTFWSQAVIAEVYTAGAAFFVWIVAALLWWQHTGNQRALLLAGLLGGLGLGVHMSLALLAPAMLLFLLLPGTAMPEEKPAQRWWKRLQRPFLGAFLGVVLAMLLFWLMDRYNPSASYFNSVIEPSRSAWGLAAEDIDSFGERLLWGWRAQQFQSFMWQTAVFPQNAAAFWQNLPQELPLLLLLTVPIGVLTLLWRRWQTAVLLLVALGMQLFFFFQYDIWDLYVFYIPSYLLITLLSIGGIGALMKGVIAFVEKIFRRNPPVNGQFVIETVFVLAIISAIWLNIQPHVQGVVDHENPFDFAEYPEYSEQLEPFALAMVMQLPPNAILFTDWDQLYPYYYVAHVQQERSDLMFIETLPADDQEKVAESLIAFVKANMIERPIYFSERIAAISEAGLLLSPERIGPFTVYQVLSE